MTDLQIVREALERLEEYARLLGATQAKKGFGVYTDGDSRLERTWHEGIANCKAKALAALSRLEAAAAAEYERGRQDGMKQEHALWQMQRIGQEIEAAAVPELSREDVVRWAREAGFEETTYGLNDTPGMYAYNMDIIQRFASLVRSNCPEIPDGSPAAPQPGATHEPPQTKPPRQA